jgi:hypothetical protein
VAGDAGAVVLNLEALLAEMNAHADQLQLAAAPAAAPATVPAGGSFRKPRH